MQAQPHAGSFLAHDLLARDERFVERERGDVATEADAVVGDGEHHALVAIAQLDLDGAARRREPAGVVHELRDRFRQARGVHHRAHVLRDVQFHRDQRVLHGDPVAHRSYEPHHVGVLQ